MEDSQLIGPVAPLAGVLESIDREAVVAAPGTAVTDQTVCDCVVWDPLEELPSAAGGVLLLVGASVMHPQLGSLLADAGEAGYVAAVIKRRGQDLTGIVETARRAGLIMLVARDELPWSIVEALLAGAIASCATTVRRAGFEATDDLFGMANAIASIAGAAITIEDLERRVLAYSSIEGQAIDAVRQESILDRKVQAIPEYDAEYLAVARAEGHVRFPSQADHELARVVVPVRIGGRLLGSIWAIDDGEPGSASRAVAALEMAAPAAALAIMSVGFREDAARRRRSEQLAAQLGATGSDQTSTLRDRLPLAIMGFGPLTDAPDLDEQRLTQIIRLNVERISPEAACARVEDAIFALVPRAAGCSSARLRRLAEEVGRSANSSNGGRLGCAFVAAINDTDQVIRARRDISTVLKAMQGSEHAVIDVDEQRHLVILEEIRRSGVADSDRLVQHVRDLVGYDERHQTAYAATLLAHFDHFGDARAAARQLGIHENSYRYRLARIKEKFGFDASDPRLRQVMWLQLRLLGDRHRSAGQRPI
ncbi:PucR family transcriptional regulator [Actinoallomurus sp. CA-150999]|uniref:PucR family transcriptional regulator n=1 Tax=Actinoallomurus sp. CA-150999 TaxID=3239887 RepID=UPI003D940335